jgi:hypothetical protein
MLACGGYDYGGDRAAVFVGVLPIDCGQISASARSGRWFTACTSTQIDGGMEGSTAEKFYGYSASSARLWSIRYSIRPV